MANNEMATTEITTQDVYNHAFEYAKQVKAEGFEGFAPPEEEAYYKGLGNVEALEDAYAEGYFAGVDAE